MAVVKFLRNFFAVIFAFVFGIFLLLLVFIIFARGILNETNIDKYIDSADVFEIKQSEILQSNNDNTLGEQISYDLLKLGISEEVTNNILKSNTFDKIVSEYVYEYVNYILFYNEMPILSCNEIIESLDYGSSKLISDEVTDEQVAIINNYIADLVNEINAEIPTNQELINMGYNIELVKIVSTISFSVEAIALMIMCLVLIFLLIRLCVYNLSKTIKTISIPILLVGIILMIGSMVEVRVMNMLVNGDGIVESMILKIVNESFKDLFIYGIALLIIGIILLVIAIIFIKNPGKKKEEVALPIKEKRSQVKEQLKDHIALSDDDIDKIDNTLTNRKSEIEEVKLPLDKIEEKQEEININNQNEIPKVNIVSEFANENVEEIKPVLLDEKKEDINTDVQNEISKIDITSSFASDDVKYEKSSDNEKIVNFSEIVEVDDKKVVKDDEIKVVEVENRDERDIDMSVEKQQVSYFEMDDEKDENMIKKDIDIEPLKNIDIKVTSPVKGKDIEVDLEKSEKEEDIELL